MLKPSLIFIKNPTQMENLMFGTFGLHREALMIAARKKQTVDRIKERARERAKQADKEAEKHDPQTRG